MVSLPAFPPASGHVTGMPRRHKPDAESNVPIVCLCVTEHVRHTYLGIPERNPDIPRPKEYLGFPRVYPSNYAERAQCQTDRQNKFITQSTCKHDTMRIYSISNRTMDHVQILTMVTEFKYKGRTPEHKARKKKEEKILHYIALYSFSHTS